MDDLTNLLSNLTLDEMKSTEDIDDLISHFNRLGVQSAKTSLKSIKEELTQKLGKEKAREYINLIIQSEKEKKFQEMVDKLEASLSGREFISPESRKIIRKKKY